MGSSRLGEGGRQKEGCRSTPAHIGMRAMSRTLLPCSSGHETETAGAPRIAASALVTARALFEQRVPVASLRGPFLSTPFRTHPVEPRANPFRRDRRHRLIPEFGKDQPIQQTPVQGLRPRCQITPGHLVRARSRNTISTGASSFTSSGWGATGGLPLTRLIDRQRSPAHERSCDWARLTGLGHDDLHFVGLMWGFRCPDKSLGGPLVLIGPTHGTRRSH